jgi:hypothetical protein
MMSQRLPAPVLLRTLFTGEAWRYALALFLVTRLLLSLWAVAALALHPLPAEPDEAVRPYLGEAPLNEGWAGLFLGPWQRFDSLHYLSIARQGYANVADSVFPPLYPLAMRLAGSLPSLFMPPGQSNLLGGILVSNLAFIGSLVLLYRLTAAELGVAAARRAAVYLAVFPTGFFLLAAYSESLFLLLSLAAVGAARHGRAWRAGMCGFLASLTRLTGWILVVPLAYEFWRGPGAGGKGQEAGSKGQGAGGKGQGAGGKGQEAGGRGAVWASVLPLLGLLLFVAFRWWQGLPALPEVYQRYWFQSTAIPGADLVTAVRLMLAGEAAFTLYLDFATAVFLAATTLLVFRRLGPTYGLYSAMLLLFMLLPTSELKPLFSFSRYALVFFPTFMLLGAAGTNPWLNRLILYPSIALYLYLSGQFFIWGWVA